MRGIARILAVIDTRKKAQIALNRALEIVQSTGSCLHVLSPNPKPTEESREKLQDLVDDIRKQGNRSSQP